MIELIDCAVNNELFVKGWMMGKDLLTLKSIHEQSISFQSRIILAKYDDKYIGSGLKSLSFLQIFVNPKYRQNGIGTSMAHLLGVDMYSYAREGNQASESFWKKLGVKTINL